MKNNIVKTLALLLSINCCVPGMLAKAEEPEEKAETGINILLGTELEDFDNQNKALSEELGINELPQFHSDDNQPLLEYQDKNEEDEDSAAKAPTEISNEEKSTEKSKGKSEESTKAEDTGLRHLQIPQKLEVVIDPWEMDGKGQIYSEEYVIRNDGETPGTLTLSNLACKVSEQSKAVVTTNRAGLHDNSEKSIYMQMIFGNGDCVCLSQENSTYQVELQPGEELTICFEGEVNEYASENWQDGDVEVSVVYSWDAKPVSDDAKEKEEADQDADSDISGEKDGVNDDEKMSQDIDRDVTDIEKNEKGKNGKEENIDEVEAEGEEVTENSEQIEGITERKDQTEETMDEEDQIEEGAAGKEDQTEEGGTEKEGQTEELGNETVEEDEEMIPSGEEPKESEEDEVSSPKVIELRDFNPIEFVVDEWEADEERQLYSVQYAVKNGGETTGLLRLSNLIYTSAEQNGIAALAEEEMPNNSESVSGHMELVLEDGEKVDFSQEVLQKNQEESGYRVILEPGEEVKFRFVGELDDASAERLRKGDITVKVLGSWDGEETAMAVE